MKITFDTLNKTEVAEVLALLTPDNKKPVEAPEAPKEVKPPKTTRKAKEVAVEPETIAETVPSITLANLKDRAKEKAQIVGREKVKECISNYAPKLTEVSKEDFEKLYKSLGEQ